MRKINFNGRSYNVFEVDTPYGHDEVICVPRQYMSGELAIEMITVIDGTAASPYAVLTVNLDCYTGARTQSDTRAYVDTNNNGHWGCEDFIHKYELGKPTGQYARSGYCTYPLYEFDLAKF